MDAVPDLRPEHVVDEPVLGDSRHAAERGCSDDRVEVMTVAGHARHGTGDAGLDP